VTHYGDVTDKASQGDTVIVSDGKIGDEGNHPGAGYGVPRHDPVGINDRLFSARATAT